MENTLEIRAVGFVVGPRCCFWTRISLYACLCFSWCVYICSVCIMRKSVHITPKNTNTSTHIRACAQKDIWSKFSKTAVRPGACFCVWKYLSVVMCAGATFTRISSTKLHIETQRATQMFTQRYSWSKKCPGSTLEADRRN